jgi:hypothetical protein
MGSTWYTDTEGIDGQSWVFAEYNAKAKMFIEYPAYSGMK